MSNRKMGVSPVRKSGIHILIKLHCILKCIFLHHYNEGKGEQAHIPPTPLLLSIEC